MSVPNESSNNNDLENTAKLMHHTLEMQEIVYDSVSITDLHLNSLDTAALNDAARAMYHSQEMQKKAYSNRQGG